ncbi:MAG: asparagine synthase (glutamine-hydrolyzing) [Chloroflexi bacterium]|nr:asparagine synthase (glutamine-hydrolyzing) [Chloroflexota bacterium]
MCGIVGISHSDGAPVDRATLETMRDSIAHRGPDDAGAYFGEGAGLGIRRLSIIDLTTGAQPIHNEDESLWIVFNGEIYNFPDLKPRLESRGHRFYTQADTEAVIHAYEEYGDDCVCHLNGMFAFAIWDTRRRRLFIARDRAGIKPLYYTQAGGRFIFGSELKAILAHPAVERRIDPISLNQYLSFEYVPAPRSIIAGVRKVQPGHTLTFEAGQVALRPYWDLRLADSEDRRRVDPVEAVRELRHELREAVCREMLSDVPVGVLLSGGIDSSGIAALMADVGAPSRRDKVASFSIAFDDPSFDESRYARAVAARAGTDHHELVVTPRLCLDVVPQLGRIMDEPLGDSSLIPTYLLSQFTRQFVKVALGGDGGDELFAGYSTLQAHRLAALYRKATPAFVQERIAPALASALPVSFDNVSLDFKLRRFLSAHDQPTAVQHHQWLGSFTPEQQRDLFAPGVLPDGADTYDPAFAHWRACDAQDELNKILYLDMKLYLDGDILPKVDRASMACSLEVRVPLLNTAVMEYVSRLPHSLKLRGLTTKHILRQSLRGLVPEHILRRGKKGFNMPVAKWLNGELRELTDDLLAPAKLRREGFFNPDYIAGLLGEHRTRRRDNRKLLWTLLAFELWLGEYG